MTSQKYNIRVYAVILNDSGELLVSDERRNNFAFTKFPGGGLEWGEGLKDGLKRELREELGVDSEITELYYVNDFFQQSAFKETDQLISFYFRANIDLSSVKTTNRHNPLTKDGEVFRWLPIREIDSGVFTFPIDKMVGEKLKRDYFDLAQS